MDLTVLGSSQFRCLKEEYQKPYSAESNVKFQVPSFRGQSRNRSRCKWSVADFACKLLPGNPVHQKHLTPPFRQSFQLLPKWVLVIELYRNAMTVYPINTPN